MAKYMRLDENPMDMETDDLQDLFWGEGWAMIMRSFLMFEIKRVKALREDGEAPETRTLRGLWYQFIKPSLDRLGALSEGFYVEPWVTNEGDYYKIPRWDGIMSQYLAELVRLGVTSYEELGIIDGSRQRRPPQGQNIQINSVPVVGVHHPGIILFTEKDTIYPIVESIARIYGISVLSGSGKPSLAATENLVREIARHKNFEKGTPVKILTLTDYDPSGYIISDAIIKQVSEIVQVIKEISGVTYLRLGLEPDQLTAEERRRNSYTPAKAGLDKWFQETGGVDGEPLGLELDALTVGQMRELFVDGIENYLITDEQPYKEDLAKAFVDMLIFEALENRIEDTIRRVREEIEADALEADLIDGTPRKLVGRFARAGFGHIDPVYHDDHVFKSAGRVRGLIEDAMSALDLLA